MNDLEAALAAIQEQLNKPLGEPTVEVLRSDEGWVFSIYMKELSSEKPIARIVWSRNNDHRDFEGDLRRSMEDLNYDLPGPHLEAVDAEGRLIASFSIPYYLAQGGWPW